MVTKKVVQYKKNNIAFVFFLCFSYPFFTVLYEPSAP